MNEKSRSSLARIRNGRRGGGDGHDGAISFYLRVMENFGAKTLEIMGKMGFGVQNGAPQTPLWDS